MFSIKRAPRSYIAPRATTRIRKRTQSIINHCATAQTPAPVNRPGHTFQDAPGHK